MKFLETHFEEYTNAVEKDNLHSKLVKVLSRFPESLNELSNLIFYGPSGVGKYSQMLYSIKKYSPTELKYEKKLNVTYEKDQYYFKISDIHYEIDMSLLGCNSKLLWHEIYQQIIDVVSSKTEKVGIIVCKNFHNIHSELLENFYSYMQENNSSYTKLVYILLTKEVSFIPENIINCCEIISIPRPTKTAYQKCSKLKIPNSLELDKIGNIKYLHSGIYDLFMPHKIICDKLIEEIINVEELKFLKFRDILYDMLIYDLDIGECIWYILTNFLKMGHISKEDISRVLVKTHNFLKYYNNNYRPIYHLESFLYYIASIIHGF